MKIYVTLTRHCIRQIKCRNPKHKKDHWAIIFGTNLFKKFINKGINKGRKVRMSYTRNGKYRITDGVHQFIFSKPYKIEYILITYVKRSIKLGKELRPKERYIRGEV